LTHLEGLISFGGSPRASIALVRCARALALLRGKDTAGVQEVYDVAYDVLNHRLILSFEAVADGVSIDDVLVEILSRYPARDGWVGAR
jgi:MoxR-like ATPase